MHATTLHVQTFCKLYGGRWDRETNSDDSGGRIGGEECRFSGVWLICCWSLLCSAILSSRADSLRSHLRQSPFKAYGSFITESRHWRMDHLPQSPFNGVRIIYHSVPSMVYRSFTTVSLQWRMDHLPRSFFNCLWIIYHSVPSMAYG